MPSLLERLETDYKTALKSGERLRVDTIRLIKAAIQRTVIEKRKATLDEGEITQVLSQQAKQRRETIEAAKQAGREDILTQTSEELAILNSYLPQQLSEEALRQLIDEAIKTFGATTPGSLIKQVLSQAAGGADGKRVSQLVNERLKQASS